MFPKNGLFLSLQAREERNYHVFYELLAGMNDWDKQELYLQGAETYYYLNQVRVPARRISEFARLFPSSVVSSVFLEGGSCELKGKQDKQDFQLLLRSFEAMGLQADQIATVWAILSSILQLGNMCFTSYEVCVQSGGHHRHFLIGVFLSFFCCFFQSESFEVALVFSETEARRVGCLLQVSSEALQTVITHRVTVSR